jgi:hypothetical protein
MTNLLAVLSLICVAGLVLVVCFFVYRLGTLLRDAEDAVNSIAADEHAIRSAAAVISPGIESMNQNLYRVAMHLGQLGEAAEALPRADRG